MDRAMAPEDVQDGQISLHFLDLPSEIRIYVYELMLEDINWERGDHWFVKPKFDFVNLMLTCRKINAELDGFLPLQVTPFNKVHKLAKKVLGTDDVPLAKGYRTLTIEFDLEAPVHTYRKLIEVLYYTSPFLEELRIYFRGCDKHQNHLYVHDCAYVTGQTSRNAPLSGQRDVEMRNIQHAIRNIRDLRILVLSNMNSQIYPAMFMNKPQLQFCHLTTDPRSVVHWPGPAQLGVLSVTPTELFPPIKVLQISANNMLNAFSFPSNCALTLEHLTWTIPDAVRGSNALNLPLFHNTNQLMNNLFMNAKKLKTLRICIQGRGSHGNPNEFLFIENAVTGGIRRLRTLRDVELHVSVKHQTLGYDILSHLPLEVERFYTNDHLVRPQQLYHFITRKYLFATQGEPDATFLARQKELLRSWSPTPRNEIKLSPHEKESIKLWIDPTTYGPVDESEQAEQAESLGTEIVREIGTKPKDYFVYGIVGEDLRRRDYIPLRDGDLKFVSYEFSNPDYKCLSGSVGETTTQMVLRLNGRLLDRDRNRHLSAVNPGDPIKPVKNFGQSSYDETATESENDHIWLQLGELYFAPGRYEEDPQHFIDELMSSDFTDDKRYFGLEDEAMKVFEEERVARPEELPSLTYPYFEDSVHDDKCHWLCPEANVPTIAQIHHVRALNAARQQAIINANANTGTNGNASGTH